MSSSPNVKLFLSSVTAEFGSYRAVLQKALKRRNLEAKVQEDFNAGGGELLLKLDDYIKACDSVVHLIGDRSGFIAPAASIAEIKKLYPELSARFPALAVGLDPANPVFSYTQWEAYLALLHGKPLFIATPRPSAVRDRFEQVSTDESQSQLAHVARLRDGRINRYAEITFVDAQELIIELYRSELLETLYKTGRLARPRVDITRLPTTFAKKLYGREAEMADLNRAWDSAEPEKTNVLVLDAMGGTGKTALVNHFVHGLAAEGWRGAEAVFVWSFYSQGTDDKRQASADPFFKTAFEWFGHTGDAPTSVHDKGVRLAELIADKRALVILDGLEPLQYGPSRRAGGSGDSGITGAIKDQGIAALVKQLAGSNAGLLIVTTRLRIPALSGTPPPAVVTEQLQRIPTLAAVELLRDLRVRGKTEELAALADDLGGHAIAVTHVGTYLATFCEGDVRRRDTVPATVDLGGDKERDPFRVMLAYETMFKRQIADQVAGGRKAGETAAGRQLELLYLMGLFDRPMMKGERDKLLEAPAIPGLTETLAVLSMRELDYAIGGLRDLGLLLPRDEDAPMDLDAHPLVREYFGLRLEKKGAVADAAGQPNTWKLAHGRLYDWYRFRGLPRAFQDPVAYGLLADQISHPNYGARRTVNDLIAGRMSDADRAKTVRALIEAKPEQLRAAAMLIDGPEWHAALTAFLPDTEERMTPLFAATAHGCAADRYNECFQEVYWPRIARGDEKFATGKLGLFGSDLAAVAHFFETPFGKPAVGLALPLHALMLNLAGFRLRALGRLEEAVEPMRAAVAAYTRLGDHAQTSANATNLSALLVLIGRMGDDPATGEAGAVTTAKGAVTYADQSGDGFHELGSRAAEGDALAAAGRWRDAVIHYAEAEAIQRERQPGLPLLYSFGGYRLCDLKLARGRTVEVRDRVQTTQGWARKALAVSGGGGNVLDVARETLMLGRAVYLAQSDEVILAPNGTIATGVGAGAEALLTEAVDRLRAAGTAHELPNGLLARALFCRETGNGKGAAVNLAEAFEIAQRGGMRFFLPACWIESARQRLIRIEPTEAAVSAAAKAVETAEAIVAETGLHRYQPDLALVRAELELAHGNRAAADIAINRLVTLVRENDLWGFLPGLRRVVDRYGLTERAPLIEKLAVERARFDAEQDALFAKARKRGDGLDDEVVDAWLAEPENRAKLDAALVDNSYSPSGSTPLEEQRDAAREFILQVERARPEPSHHTIDPDLVPDELVDQMLTQDRGTLADFLREKGHDLSSLSPHEQRRAARQLIAAIVSQQQAEQQQSSETPPPLPDGMVDAMLTDDDMRDTLAKVYKQVGVNVPFDSIPHEMHVRIIAKLVADGHVEIRQGSEATGSPALEPTPLPETPHAAKPDPTPPDREPPGRFTGGVLSRLFGRWMR